jgi:hypothetical protein
MNSHAANLGAAAVTADLTHPPFEVGDLFRDYGPVYRAEHALTREQSTALSALANCRTKELGGTLTNVTSAAIRKSATTPAATATARNAAPANAVTGSRHAPATYYPFNTFTWCSPYPRRCWR